MSFSLNEIQATAKKATRGAGYSWGMAEEAAMATGWLCGCGIDASRALAKALNAANEQDLTHMAPQNMGTKWQAISGIMCPLIAGVQIADFAAIAGPGKTEIDKVVAPVLLLPFAAIAARKTGGIVRIEWDGVLAKTDGYALHVSGDIPVLHTDISPVTITRFGAPAGDLPSPTMPRHNRATPDPRDWQTLGQFAQRIYAPATRDSRLKGAGAGLSDND